MLLNEGLYIWERHVNFNFYVLEAFYKTNFREGAILPSIKSTNLPMWRDLA